MSSSVLLILVFPIVFAMGLCIYFVPTIVALSRKHLQKTAIILLNIFLGWTFIGWVVALVWSVMRTNNPQNPTISNQSFIPVQPNYAPTQQFYQTPQQNQNSVKDNNEYAGNAYPSEQ